MNMTIFRGPDNKLYTIIHWVNRGWAHWWDRYKEYEAIPYKHKEETHQTDSLEDYEPIAHT